MFFSQKYIILLTLGEQSKLLVLSYASVFSCSCCFDLSYPLYSVQVSLDCTTEGRQINQWKVSAAAINPSNFFTNVKSFALFLVPLLDIYA